MIESHLGKQALFRALALRALSALGALGTLGLRESLRAL